MDIDDSFDLFNSIAEAHHPLWQKIEDQHGEEVFGNHVFNRFCEALLKDDHHNVIFFGFTTPGHLMRLESDCCYPERGTPGYLASGGCRP